MNNAGTFTLAALQITAAKTLALLSPTTDLDGMAGVTLTMNFKYGSGSGTVTAIVATTLDGGTVWHQIARADFANASALKYCSLGSEADVAGIALYADLGAEGVNNGLLGNQLALMLAVTGSYQNTTLDVRASVR
jgi:hypothetical protein